MGTPSALPGEGANRRHRASGVDGTHRVQHLVMWAADTDRLVDDLLAMDVCLRSVTEALAQAEGIVWATHDLDRESVCFSLMVDDWSRGSDDGLAAARLRARSCLRRCLIAAGLMASARSAGKVVIQPVRLRLDPTPLSLRAPTW